MGPVVLRLREARFKRFCGAPHRAPDSFTHSRSARDEVALAESRLVARRKTEPLVRLAGNPGLLSNIVPGKVSPVIVQ